MSNLEDVTVLTYLRPVTSLKDSVKVELQKLLAEIYFIGGDWTRVCVDNTGVNRDGQNQTGLLGRTTHSGGMVVHGGGGSGRMVLGGVGGGGSGLVLGGGGSGLALGGGGGSGLALGGGGLRMSGLGDLQQQGTSRYDRIYASIKLIQGSLFGADQPNIPGLYIFKTALESLENCVDQAKSQGQGITLLPTCQYLKGILVMLLESHAYWDAKVAGESPPEFIKNLQLPQPNVQNDPVQVLQAIPQQIITNQNQPSSNLEIAESSSTSHKASEQEESIEVKICLADRLHSSLLNLWKNKVHADITLIVGNKRIQAHKIILASRSEYFDKLVFGSMKECQQEEIEIKDVENVDLFELMLEYAYTGSININGNIQIVFDILTLADRFGFLLLKNALGAIIAKRVNASNAIKFLPAADAYCIDALREKCLEQLDECSSSVLTSDDLLSLDPVLVKMIVSRETFDAPEIDIFECLVKVIKMLNMESREASELLLSCVNLSSIVPEDLFGKVEPTGYFTETVILQSIRAMTKNDLNLIHGRGIRVFNFNVLSTAACDIHLRYLQQLGRRNRQPPPVLIDGIVDLHKQSPTVTLTLSKSYLANCIKLEVFPSRVIQGLSRPATDRNLLAIAQNQVDSLKVSFSLNVSKDNVRWITVANYKAYQCMGEVVLIFPTQAMRYIKFELVGDIPFSVRFHECVYKELKYKPQVGINGVSAPVQEIQPLACQSSISNTDHDIFQSLSGLVPGWNTQGDDGFLVFLCQPYFVTHLRFEVAVDSSSVVRVFISEKKTSGYKEISCTHSTLDDSTCPSYSATFPPVTVSYIFVFIKSTENQKAKV